MSLHFPPQQKPAIRLAHGTAWVQPRWRRALAAGILQLTWLSQTPVFVAGQTVADPPQTAPAAAVTKRSVPPRRISPANTQLAAPESTARPAVKPAHAQGILPATFSQTQAAPTTGNAPRVSNAQAVNPAAAKAPQGEPPLPQLQIPWFWFLQGNSAEAKATSDRFAPLQALKLPALGLFLLFGGWVYSQRLPLLKRPPGFPPVAELHVLKTLRLGRSTLYLVAADDSRFLVGTDALGLKQIIRVEDESAWNGNPLTTAALADSAPDATAMGVQPTRLPHTMESDRPRSTSGPSYRDTVRHETHVSPRLPAMAGSFAQRLEVMARAGAPVGGTASAWPETTAFESALRHWEGRS